MGDQCSFSLVLFTIDSMLCADVSRRWSHPTFCTCRRPRRARKCALCCSCAILPSQPGSIFFQPPNGLTYVRYFHQGGIRQFKSEILCSTSCPLNHLTDPGKASPHSGNAFISFGGKEIKAPVRPVCVVYTGLYHAHVVAVVHLERHRSACRRPAVCSLGCNFWPLLFRPT